MAKLTAKGRANLPKSDFAVPGGTAARKSAGGGGSYPIPDRSHAANALARASQSGNPSTIKAVRAKVDAKYPGLRQKPASKPKGK